jgi:hypothetical protein
MKRGKIKSKNSKKGQLKISFGMIFSIILIIAFLGVAIYAIVQFLSLLQCAETGMFKEDLQNKIDRAWKGGESRATFSKDLPSGLTRVCFIDLNGQAKGEHSNIFENISRRYGGRDGKNMFFWPMGEACSGQESFQIKHINISKITSRKNPYCIEAERGKVTIKIEKGIYDALVNIK